MPDIDIHPDIWRDKALGEVAAVLLTLREQITDDRARVTIVRALAELVDGDLPPKLETLACECPRCGRKRRHDASRRALEGEHAEARVEAAERERAVRLASPEGVAAMMHAEIDRQDARNAKLLQAEKERRAELREMITGLSDTNVPAEAQQGFIKVWAGPKSAEGEML